MKILDLLNENDDPVVTARNNLALAQRELQELEVKIRDMQGPQRQAKRAAVASARQAVTAAQQQKNTQQQPNTQQPQAQPNTQQPQAQPNNTQQTSTQQPNSQQPNSQQPNNQTIGSTQPQ